MERKLCNTCPYIIGNGPYICEIGNAPVDIDSVKECIWHPDNEVDNE